MASQVPAVSGRAGGGGGGGRVQYVTERPAARAAPPRKFCVGAPRGQDGRDDADDDNEEEGVVSNVLRRYLRVRFGMSGAGCRARMSGAFSTDACARTRMRAPVCVCARTHICLWEFARVLRRVPFVGASLAEGIASTVPGLP